MRVIICGAGQVGYNIASYLAREDNDITVVDKDPAIVARLNDDMDVNGIVGHASNPDILSQAGANEADMIIAVTHADEVNMVACQVAHSLFNVPKKIARIREQNYLEPAWSNLFSRAHMPIDAIISPEIEVARSISQRLHIPGTTNVVSLAEDQIYMVGVICGEDCPVVNTQMKQLSSLFPDLTLQVTLILRNGNVIIPDTDEQMLVGDEVYLFVTAEHLQRTLSIFGHEEKEARHIVIIGGGNIGLYLTNILKEEYRDVHIKIIERDPDRARFLSEKLNNTIVLNGDALQHDVLEEVNIAYAETMVAVTNDDETNILSSLLAKQYGCKRVVTLVDKPTYSNLISSLGIDAVVSPRASTVSKIMRHVRRGRIKALHTLRDGFAEVIEAEVSDTTELANKAIKDIDLPEGVILGPILRKEEIMLPTPDCTIKPGDHVMILTLQEQARKVEKMFSVQVDLF